VNPLTSTKERSFGRNNYLDSQRDNPLIQIRALKEYNSKHPEASSHSDWKKLWKNDWKERK
jgi:hypothetical protein